MNSSFPTRSAMARPHRLKTLRLRAPLASILLIGLLLACAFPSLSPLRGQNALEPSTTGNPTGDSGGFSGQVTTGGSYDPFTGNATRTIVDAVTPGTSGTYGLSFARTSNSRRGFTGGYDQFFGDGGNWRHSFQWSFIKGKIDDADFYRIGYPDGRIVDYPDDMNGVDAPYLRGPLGTSDRLEKVDGPGFTSDESFILHLSDGGRVIFADRGQGKPPVISYPPRPSYIDFWRAEKVIDPFGAVTRLRYSDEVSFNGEGSNNALLTEVREPAGRTLRLFYATYSYDGEYVQPALVQVQVVLNGNVLTTVVYAYEYLLAYSNPGSEGGVGGPDTNFGGPDQNYTPYLILNKVIYTNEPSIDGPNTYASGLVEAHYAYASTIDARPLLTDCADPHFGGALAKIHYTYTNYNPPNTQFLETGVVTTEGGSTTVVTALNRTDRQNPVETRADGPQRFFHYGELSFVFGNNTVATGALPHDLTSFTDFEGHLSYYTYQNGYRASVIDRRGNTTSFTREPFLGQITDIAFPPTVSTSGGPAVSAHRSYVYTDADNPYYLAQRTDERGFVTTIHRNNPTTDPANPDVHLVTSVNYPDGSLESFTYQKFTLNMAAFYKVKSHITVLGATVTNTYDEAGHGGSGLPGLLTSVTRPRGDAGAGNVTAYYYYDNLDRLVRTQDERGNNSYIGDASGQGGYNGRQQVVRMTHADNSYVTYAYDDYGNRTTVTDELTHPATTVYDDYRRPIRQTVQINDPISMIQSLTTAMFYERVTSLPGAPAQVAGNAYTHTSATVGTMVMPSGKAVQRSYTPNENLLAQESGLMGDPNTGAVQTTADAATTTYLYDMSDNSASITWPASNGTTLTTQSTYDARNWLLTSIDPNGLVTTYTHDLSGNLARVDLPLDMQSDPARGPVLYADPTDPNDHNRLNNYDPMNRRRWTQDSKGQHTMVLYDPAGNVTSLTDDKLNVTLFGFDLLGRKRSITYPTEPDTGATRTEAWTYDEVGNRMSYKNRAEATQMFNPYDVRNRSTSYVWQNDGGATPAVTMSFDAASRLTGLSNVNSTLSYDYNDANQLTSETQTIGSYASKVTYKLNTDALVQVLGYPSGTTVSQDFNYRNNLTQISTAAGSVATLTWNSDDTPNTRALGNNTTTTWTYDVNGRINQSLHSGPAGIISQRQYGYNPKNQLSWFNRVSEMPATINYYPAGLMPLTTPTTQPANTVGTGDACIYDAAGQLIRIRQDATDSRGTPGDINGNSYANTAASNPRHTHAFRYDGVGNRVGADFDSATSTTGVDALNRYTVSTRNDGQTFPFTYDERGNTTSQLGWTYAYDAQGRLITANGTQTRLIDAATVTHAITFRYDPLGRCCQRTLDGATTNLVYDGWDLIEERTAQNALIYLYVHGAGSDEMLCRQSAAGTRLYYHYDALGNVTHLTDTGGAVVESYRYMPYGRPEIFDANGNQIINDVGDALSLVGNRFLFKGREYLERPELYDLRNRHYSPESGRFLQPDPASFGASGPNLYAYCGNDPVNKADPSGLQAPGAPDVIRIIGNSDDGVSPPPTRIEITGVYPRFGRENLGDPFQGTGLGGRDNVSSTGEIGSGDPRFPIGSTQNPQRIVIEGEPLKEDPLRFPMKLPNGPGDLGPEWVLDPTHRNPNGQRFRGPGGRFLDWHPGTFGKPGWRGEDHWHDSGGKEHLEPGTEVPDPSSMGQWVVPGVAVVGGGYLIYRIIRMVPSVAFPPLWPTIPANAAIP